MTEQQATTTRTAILMGLFGVPMLAGSLFMCWLLYGFFRDGRAMRSWAEVPATIVQSELVASRPSSPASAQRAQKAQYSVRAAYSYTYGGKEYAGDRVEIHRLADNFSPSHHRRLAELLARHRGSGEPMPCFVDPGDPASSILFRDPPLYQVGVLSSFALVFFTLGFGGVMGALKHPLQRVRGPGSVPVRVYEALFGVVVTAALVLIVVPITYFTLRDLGEGAAVGQAGWLVLPILVVLSTWYGIKKQRRAAVNLTAGECRGRS